MTDRTFIDTNVLVYHYSADEPEKQRIATERLTSLVRWRRAVVSTQVLQELYAVLTRKLGAAPESARVCVEAAARNPVVGSDGPFVLDAVRLSAAARISIWDALIVAAAQTSGCTVLLSEDLNHGQRFGSVVVENPFG